jgi:hypothetical protein
MLTRSKEEQPMNAPMPKNERPSGTSKDVKLVQDSNAWYPMTDNFSGKVMADKLTHCAKANVEIVSTLSDSVTLVRAEQYLKEAGPMFFTPSGISTWLKLKHDSKAYWLITSRLPDRVTDCKAVQAQKAWLPMEVTLLGRVTDSRLSQA